MNPGKILEKLFFQVCCSADISGVKTLEDSEVIENANTLVTFFSIDTHALISMPEDRLQLITALNQLIEYQTLLESVQPQNADLFITKVLAQISVLKPGDYFLLPGGGVNVRDHQDEHFAVYEIRKIANDNLIFTIYTSGRGKKFHPQSYGKFDSALAYEIPATSLKDPEDEKNLETFVRALFSYGRNKQLLTENNNAELTPTELFYKNIFPSSAFLDARLVERDVVIPVSPQKRKIRDTRGHLACNSGISVFLEMVKDHYDSIDNYRRFIFHFKKYLLTQYFDNLMSKKITLDKHKARLVNNSIKSLLRFLNRMTNNRKEYLFSEDFIKIEFGILISYLKMFSQITMVSIAEFGTFIKDEQLLPSLKFPYPKNMTSSARHAESPAQNPHPAVIEPENIPFQFNIEEPTFPQTTDLLNDLNLAIASIKKLTTAPSLQYETAVERLEELIFVQLPLPSNIDAPLSPPYHSLNTEEKIQQFFALLGQLNSLVPDVYKGHINQLNLQCGQVNSILVHHILLRIMVLAAHAFTALPEYQDQDGSYKKYLCHAMGTFPDLDHMLNDYTIATNRPSVDCEYIALCHIVHRYLGSQEIKTRERPDDIPPEELEFLMLGLHIKDPELSQIGVQLSEKSFADKIDKIKDSPNHKTVERLKEEQYYLQQHTLITLHGLLSNMWPDNNTKQIIYSRRLSDLLTSEQESISLKVDNFKFKLESLMMFVLIYTNSLMSERNYQTNVYESFWSVYDFQPSEQTIKNKFRKHGITYQFSRRHKKLRSDREFGQRRFRSNQFREPDYSFPLRVENARIESNMILNVDSAVMLSYHNQKYSYQVLLRTVQATQIVQTLDYFLRNLQTLKDVKCQSYIEANLLLPGIITSHLQKNPHGFLAHFRKLIDAGLDLYKTGLCLAHENIFFIRLTFLVYQYAARVDRYLYIAKLHEFYAELNLFLTHSSLLTVTRALLKYRLLTVVEIINLSGMKNLSSAQQQEYIENNMVSLFALERLEESVEAEDHESRYQYFIALQNAKKQLKNVPAFMIEKAIIKVAKDLNVGIEQHTYQFFQYPTYRFDFPHAKSIIFDLDTFSIHHEESIYTKLPKHIKNHPLLTYFNFGCITDGFKDRKRDDTWIIKSGKITLEIGRNNYIQGVPDLPVDERYQIIPVSDCQAHFVNGASLSQLFSGDNDDICLSDNIAGPGTLALFRCSETSEQHFVLLKKDAQQVSIALEGTQQSQQLIISRYGTNRVLCPQARSQFTELFSRFESYKYIDIEYDQDEENYHINLLRYGLIFFGPDINHLTCQINGKIYRLNQQTTSLLDNHIPQLELYNDTEQEKLIVLPINYFVASSNPYGNIYQQFTLDTNNTILTHLLELKSDQEKTLQFRFSLSMKYFLVKANEYAFLPEYSFQALYLAYLYLGLHEPEKALIMFDHCLNKLGNISGDFYVVETLYKIVQCLPYSLGYNGDQQRTRATDKVIESAPAVIACQLKALAILCQLNPQAMAKLQKTIKSLIVESPHTKNELVDNLHLQNMQDFLSPLHLCSLILKLYGRLLDFTSEEEDIPKQVLSESERWSLLEFCNRQEKLKEWLAFEYQLYYVSILQKEIRLLDQKSDVLLKKRRSYLAHILSELQFINFKKIVPMLSCFGVTNTQVFIASSKWQNLISTAVRLNFVDMMLNNSPFNTTPDGLKAVMDNMHYEMKPEAVLQNFLTYVQIAGDKTHQYFDRVNKFCIRALTAYAQADGEQEYSPTRWLAGILFWICSSSDGDFLPRVKEIFQQAEKEELRAYRNDRLDEGNLKLQKTERFMTAIYQALRQSDGVSLPIYRLKDVVPDQMNLNNVMLALPKTTPAVEPVPLLTTKQQSPPLQSSVHAKHLKTVCDDLRQAFTVEKAVIDHAAAHTTFFECDEYKVGRHQYYVLNNLKAFSARLFATEANLTKLKASVLAESQTFSAELEKLEKAILTLACSELTLHQQIDIESNIVLRLDLNKLLTLYLNNDINEYRQTTSLTDQKIIELHDLLVKYVGDKTALQRFQRILGLVEDSLNTENVTERDAIKLKLAQSLLSENKISAEQNTVLSFFQLHENLLLTPEQIDALNSILSESLADKPSEKVIKMIMGAGKSKVLLPLLAYHKANGFNLPIVEVPRALLQNCYADLQRTSKTIFNQNAVLFEFDRNSDCSLNNLCHLYNLLVQVMQTKGYLVTAGESLQSLELKYLEFLRNKPSESASHEALNNWQESVKLLDQMIMMFTSRGDLMIDEVHHALLIKNKLNYAIGEAHYLAPDIIHAAVKFFRYLTTLKFKIAENDIEFADVLTRKTHLNPEDYLCLCEQVVDKLLTDTSAPLKSLINTLRNKKPQGETIASFHQRLKAYLLNQSGGDPDFVTSASLEHKEVLAFYKVELSKLLAITLDRKHLSSYGESLDPTMPPAERAIAIPYHCNNTPKYGSNFSNEVETTNYTIQAMLLSGISFDLFEKLLNDLHSAATIEKNLLSIAVDDTQSGQLFNDIISFAQLEKSKLSEVQLTQTMLKALYERLKYNKEVIFTALERLVLNKIKTDSFVLHADAAAHVDIAQKCTGLTGTPWNSSTYHYRLTRDTITGLGSDGYIVHALNEKNTSLLGVDFSNVDHFIQHLFEKTFDNNTRVIIDISATFNGIANETLARSVVKNYLKAIKTRKDLPSFKYILYFNANNQLAAMPVTNVPSDQVPVTIGQSNPQWIVKVLGVTLDELMTIYDEAHCTGTDLKQLDNANALVLVDQKLHLHHFLQGVMRMRGLIERQQSVKIVMPEKMLAHLHSYQQGEVFEHFINLLFENEQQQLKADNFQAVVNHLYNAARRDLLQRILAHDTLYTEGKSELYECFEAFFTTEHTPSLFARFGTVTKTLETEKLVQEIIETIVMQWQKMLLEAGCATRDTISSHIQGIRDKLQMIAKNRGPCAEVQNINSLHIGEEVEVQNDLQQNMQIQQQLVSTVKDQPEPESESQFQECNKYLSIKDWLLQPQQTKKSSSKNPSMVDTLNTICATTIFDNTLLVSRNYTASSINQSSVFNKRLKPVMNLCFIQRGQQLQCLILTQQECAEVLDFLNTDASHAQGIWITNTSNSLLGGQCPVIIANEPRYHSLLTQVRYFSGEFNLILKDNEIDSSWLRQEAHKKTEFYRKHLYDMRSYEDNTDVLFREAEEFFSVYRLAVEQVVAEPDISEENLKEKWHSFSEHEINELRRAAQQFKMLVGQWSTSQFKKLCDKDTSKCGLFYYDFNEYLTALKSLSDMTDSLNSLRELPVVTHAIISFHPFLVTIPFALLNTLKTVNHCDLSHKNNFYLAYAMALNPNLNNPAVLDELFNLSKINLMVCYALLNNTAKVPNLKTHHLKELLENGMLSADILKSIAAHRSINNTLKDTFLGKLASLNLAESDKQIILRNLFANHNFSLEKIHEIIKSKKFILHENVILSLIQRIHGSARYRGWRARIYAALIEHCPDMSDNLIAAILPKLAKTAENIDQLSLVKSHKAVSRTALKLMIENKQCKESMVDVLLETHANLLTGEHLTSVINNPAIQLSLKVMMKIARLFVKQIDNARVSINDIVINETVTEYTTQLDSIAAESQQLGTPRDDCGSLTHVQRSEDELLDDLKRICKELSASYEYANSPYMQFARARIQALRSTTFAIGAFGKAEKLKQQVQSLTLKERADIISSGALTPRTSGITEVLKSVLNVHRYPRWSNISGVHDNEPTQSMREFVLFQTNLSKKSEITYRGNGLNPQTIISTFKTIIKDYKFKANISNNPLRGISNLFTSLSTEAERKRCSEELMRRLQLCLEGQPVWFEDLVGYPLDNIAQDILIQHGLLAHDGSIDLDMVNRLCAVTQRMTRRN